MNIKSNEYATHVNSTPHVLIFHGKAADVMRTVHTMLIKDPSLLTGKIPLNHINNLMQALDAQNDTGADLGNNDLLIMGDAISGFASLGYSLTEDTIPLFGEDIDSILETTYVETFWK